MKKNILIIVLITQGLFGATMNQNQEIVKIDNKITKELLGAFGKNLKQQIKTKGFTGAINFCAKNAWSLQAKVAEKNNVSIIRISDKNRNPLNEPRDYFEKVLIKNYKEKKIIRPFIRKEKDKILYYKPLYIKKVCLKCHGQHISPKVKKEINKFYPQDKATGYKVGDFRGFIVIEKEKR